MTDKLHDVIIAKDVLKLSALLSTGPIKTLIEGRDKLNRTPLHLAALLGNFEAVEVFKVKNE